MKVLCTIDGSEFSHWGAEAVGILAAQPPSSLVLLHVVATSDISSLKGVRSALRKQTIIALEEAGHRLLRRTKEAVTVVLSQQAERPMTKITTVLARGSVAEAIVRQAHRRRVDLIMVGSRGFSDIRGFLLGSVSRKVVTSAPCPVLVVKRKLTAIHHTVLAVDDSKFSKAVVDFLLNEFAGEPTRITILSVVNPVVTSLGTEVLTSRQVSDLTKPKEAQLRSVVSQYRKMFLKEGWAVETKILKGHPGQTIIHYLETHSADLVAVGSRSLTGTERLQLGSVSEAVLKYAPCSVLVVRGRRR